MHYSLARDLLSEGHLFDRAVREGGEVLPLRIEGLCPAALARRLEKHRSSNTMSARLERVGAAAALAALERDEVCRSPGSATSEIAKIEAESLAAQTAESHVWFAWRLVVSRPSDWADPANPHSLDQRDLRRFDESEYRTIALHRLVGLSDVDALRPLIAMPSTTGDLAQDVAAYAAWRSRLPMDAAFGDRGQASPHARLLAADVAEQLLEDVLPWFRSEAARRGDVLMASGENTAPDREGIKIGTEDPVRHVDVGVSRARALATDADESTGPALTPNQSRVLQTMERFDASRLISADAIAAEMDAAGRLSARTIGPIVRRLIELRLAERPEGDRSGARLTTAGRRLASRIAD